jgi:ankyrin repeat protein
LPKDIRTALKNLPKGSGAYDRAYQEAMNRVERQGPKSVQFAKLVLSWITCAKRPLTTSELQHALAVEVGVPKLDEDNLPQVEDMVSVCAGLVTVDDESGIIRLVHYTTQEYFERTQQVWFPNAVTDIAKVCSTYLSFDTFESGFCLTDKEFEERLQLNPLYGYAAQSWGYHMTVASTEIQNSVWGFLTSEAMVSACSQAILASAEYSQNIPRKMTGIHLTAYFGLPDMTTTLLRNGYHSDCKDTYGRTPLWWAAERGHGAVVQLLVERDDVVVDSKDNDGRTALWRAARNGHEAIVRRLLDKGADPDLRDSYGGTALWWAARDGHETVVQKLLDKGADPNIADGYGRTPLWRAARNGHEAIVRRLLDRGADPNLRDNWGGTALCYAAVNGNKVLVELLQSSSRLPS